MVKLDLQRFAEGVDAGAGAQSGGVDTGAAANGQTAAPEAATQQQEQGQQQPTFQELVQGQYRNEYEQAVGQRIQSAIQDRFKNQQNYRQQLEATQPIMAALGHKFGLDPTDMAGITAKLNEDAYAEEASQRGVPVDVVRNEHQLKDRVAAQERQLQEVQQEQQFRQHYANLQQQAAEFAQEFPGFDLMGEIRSNPDFARLTSPQFGLNVRQAYYAVHGPQMQAQGMQYAAQQAGRNIAASVAAGASRPQENGMGAQHTSAQLTFDPLNMTPQQRAEYRDRLHRGQSIPI